MVCDTGRVSDFSLPWWSLQFARQANQINNVEPKEASGNAVSWEKTGNKSCVFSVLLLYVTEVTDCHLWPGAAFFFSTRLWNSPRQTQTYQDSRFQERISVTTFLTVESSLQFSVQQVHPKTSRRWWLRARSRSKRLIHCDFIVHLCFF